ncbi:DegV family protein [Peptoniphilus sp. MSJ-1]|uniref:DegV family protein n=1 Tax=Peptoniphilus ovalis TaxID=2841503 RepID=A0ABS6FED3_9FIRM|nr:DegV family protein [Peptoniphilus ovalis]MBU5668530.1 DegV family protein [Peptoniphilus ovalis]
MAIKIIAGSTADVIKNIEDNIIRVPLHINFGEDDFLDSVDITKKEFYEKLEAGEFPTTSQPNPYAFLEKYKEIINAGDEAIVITISSKLSGTYNSAKIAAEGLEDKIRVIDSETASIGEGALVEIAQKLIDEGKKLDEIEEIITRERKNLVVIALLDTLEYLLKGGRISKTSAFFGKLLSVKVAVTIKDGELVPLGKARGIKNANNLLVTEIEKNGVDFDKPIVIGYTGNDSSKIEKYLQATENIWKDRANLEYVQIGSVIGTHAGPGALGLAFYKK